MARWYSANVLQATGEAKRLWQFIIRGNNPALAREESKLPTESLPTKLVAKDWQTLYQPRLNVAWVPADKAFLRGLELPAPGPFQGTGLMVEPSVEKPSPLPVAQIVWTFELVPRRE